MYEQAKLKLKDPMTRFTTLTAVILAAGCGQREQSAAVVVTPAVAAADTPATLKPLALPPIPVVPKPIVAQPPKPVENPPGFEYPPDLGGKAVAKSVTPVIPTPTTEKFGEKPIPRSAPARVLNPEPTVKASYTPPTLLSPAAGRVALSPPKEGIPADLGRGADLPPVRPPLPIAAGVTERARDVNLPPPLPILGRPFSERTSLDDPTSDFANAAIVMPAVTTSLPSAEFQKVSLPDPFELGVQVKPQVPPAAEPVLDPVPVNPARVK